MVTLSPTLSQQPTPVGQTSAVGFGSVGQGLASLGNVFRSAAPQPEAQPSVSEQRFVLEQTGLANLNANLSAIVSNPDLSPQERQLMINTAMAEAATYGIDPRTGAAGAMVESYLGVPADDAHFSQDQRLINDLQGSAEGQGMLLAAQAALFDPDNPEAEITASDVAQEIRRREALSAETANMQANWDVNGRVTFTNYSNQLINDIMNAHDVLTQSGVTITNTMVYETSQAVRREYQKLVSQTGPFATDPIVEEQGQRIEFVLDELSRIANPTDMDVDTLTPRQVQQLDRVVAVFNSDDPAVIDAYKALDAGSDIFNLSGEAATQLFNNISTNPVLQNIVVQQPRWMEQAGILNSNNMLAISEAIVNESTTVGGAQNILSHEILSYLPNPEEGGTYTSAELNEITEGVLAQVQSVDVPVQSMNGSQRNAYTQATGVLAATLHYHTIDLDGLAGSYYSATKARQIGTTIINNVNNIRQYDPETALAIQTTAYTGLGRMRANAEAALATVNSEGLVFQETSDGRVIVRFGGDDMIQEKVLVNQIADRYYGGDLRAMAEDREFSVIREDAGAAEFFAGLDTTGIEISTFAPQYGEESIFFGLLPRLRASVPTESITVGIEARNSLRTFLTLEEQLKPDFVREYEEAVVAQQQEAADIGSESVATFMSLDPDVQLPEALRGDTEFVGSLNSTAGNLGLPANWLLALINFETGGTGRADIVNPDTNATGLIQFMPTTAEGLGTSVEELARMTPTQQMEYVERYLRPYADRIKRPEDLYMAVFFPHAIGKPDDFVLGSDGQGPSPEKIAEQNPLFNPDGDNQVTAGDVRRVIMGNSRFTDYLSGTAPSEIQVSTLPPQEPATAAPARPQTSMPTGMAAPATQVVDQTTASPAVTAAPVVDTSTPFLGRPQNPEQPVQVPQEIVDSLAGVAEGVKAIAGGSSGTARRIDRMISEGRGEGISYRDITQLIQDMQALPRTPKRQEVLADLYEIRDTLTNR